MRKTRSDSAISAIKRTFRNEQLIVDYNHHDRRRRYCPRAQTCESFPRRYSRYRRRFTTTNVVMHVYWGDLVIWAVRLRATTKEKRWVLPAKFFCRVPVTRFYRIRVCIHVCMYVCVRVCVPLVIYRWSIRCRRDEWRTYAPYINIVFFF